MSDYMAARRTTFIWAVYVALVDYINLDHVVVGVVCVSTCKDANWTILLQVVCPEVLDDDIRPLVAVGGKE